MTASDTPLEAYRTEALTWNVSDAFGWIALKTQRALRGTVVRVVEHDLCALIALTEVASPEAEAGQTLFSATTDRWDLGGCCNRVLSSWQVQQIRERITQLGAVIDPDARGDVEVDVELLP